ncbi:hypothetical protein THAOC_23497 [Thalassiosira oceanica]|uniref:Uncharacterized protein n=1 Tax=Thalassiosira oceanica TaxID=159749 RepID=K0RVZ1_THAOC|nr:hypothetical protein THAOC_23497 [Thalassiosira oceanica]|eukprot:EJK56589.1 hypothetical protein THAOC_23497 [Thalassiosira oceanica]
MTETFGEHKDFAEHIVGIFRAEAADFLALCCQCENMGIQTKENIGKIREIFERCDTSAAALQEISVLERNRLIDECSSVIGENEETVAILQDRISRIEEIKKFTKDFLESSEGEFGNQSGSASNVSS